MKPTDLVPTLETCRALKEAGFEQDTAFVWAQYKDNAPYLIVEEKRHWRIIAAAPTLEEILRALPKEYAGGYLVLRPGQYIAYVADRRFHCVTYVRRGDDADAAARLWLMVQNPEATLGDFPIDSAGT